MTDTETQATQPTQQWVRKPNWIRSEDGNWINWNMVETVRVQVSYADQETKSFNAVAQSNIGLARLKGGFETPEAAQQWLDQLTLFYDLVEVPAKP